MKMLFFKHIELVSNKHKKGFENFELYWSLTYLSFCCLFMLFSGCASNLHFSFSIGFPLRITSSAVALKICVKFSGTKKYKSMIMVKKEKIVFSAKKSKIT